MAALLSGVFARDLRDDGRVAQPNKGSRHPPGLANHKYLMVAMLRRNAMGKAQGLAA
jgi:hypothetical protein